MARLAGVDLPRNKKIEFALPYIYGIGLTSSRNILERTGVDPSTRVHELTEDQIIALRNELSDNYSIEGELRGMLSRNLKRLMDINCYRGVRHKRRLPVRGQRTHTNARTRKGRAKQPVRKKK